MPQEINHFTYSKGKNPDCIKCHGDGSHMYDENHGKPCDLCCDHGLGFWQLKVNYNEKIKERLPEEEQIYGKDAGKYCCYVGCGFVKEKLEKEDKLISIE